MERHFWEGNILLNKIKLIILFVYKRRNRDLKIIKVLIKIFDFSFIKKLLIFNTANDMEKSFQ